MLDSAAFREPRQLVWDEAPCTHCLLCAEACPTAAFNIYKRRLQGVDEAKCVLCGACVPICHVDALKIEKKL